MTIQLTSTEIQTFEQLFKGYSAPETGDIQEALATLGKHNGDLNTSFNKLWSERVGTPQTYDPQGKSLWKVTLKVLRQEVCGDEGFRGKVKEYTSNPGSAPLLAGLIVSLVGIARAHRVPLDPAITTIVVLYILKNGLNIFCEYTEPPVS